MVSTAPVAERQTRRQVLASLLAAAGSAGVATRGWAREPVRTAPSLRVLCYNTHLLPGIAQSIAGKRGQDDYRAQAIAHKIASYDLVGLCEVFEARRRQEIVRIVQEESSEAFHYVELATRSKRSFVGSGLLLLTRYPIEGEPHFLTYSSASRVFTHGPRADGLAAKGALHAQLRIGGNEDEGEPGELVDCFLTHLESISAKARAKQIMQLAEFVAEHSSPDRPLILMGDLNTSADYPAAMPANGLDEDPADLPATNSEYQNLTNALRHGDRKLVDLWAATRADRGGTRDALAKEDCNRIDYIFLSPPGGDALACWQPAAVRVEPFLDAEVKQGSLSDHAAVECELALRPSR